MADARGPTLDILRPVIDTYRDCAVALIGCHSSGLARKSCEYDVLLVGDELRPGDSLKVGSRYIDLLFLSSREVLRPSDPETAVSVAQAKTVKDNAMVLSTGSSAAAAVLGESYRLSAESRLAASLKELGRAEEALSSGASQDADFWLLAATYDYAFAWLYSVEVRPAPSHLLSQLKLLSKGSHARYAAFSRAAGLERASRHECLSRLDSMSVVYDVFDASRADPEMVRASAARVAYQIVTEKSTQLMDSIQHVDCYTFLGYEVVKALPRLAGTRDGSERGERAEPRLVSALSQGDRRMIGERVVKGLGLDRTKEGVESGLASLREQVAGLFKGT